MAAGLLILLFGLANAFAEPHVWDGAVDPVVTSLAVFTGTLAGLYVIAALRSWRRPARALLILSGCVAAALLATLAAAWAGDRAYTQQSAEAHAQALAAMASACDSPVAEEVIAFGEEFGRVIPVSGETVRGYFGDGQGNTEDGKTMAVYTGGCWASIAVPADEGVAAAFHRAAARLGWSAEHEDFYRPDPIDRDTATSPSGVTMSYSNWDNLSTADSDVMLIGG
jgi:hypothetical protein